MVILRGVGVACSWPCGERRGAELHENVIAKDLPQRFVYLAPPRLCRCGTERRGAFDHIDVQVALLVDVYSAKAGKHPGDFDELFVEGNAGRTRRRLRRRLCVPEQHADGHDREH